MAKVARTKAYLANYSLIPLEIGVYCLKNKLISPFQVYLLLKSKSDGKIKIDNKILKSLASDLKVDCIRTITNNLKILISLNFIGFDKKSRVYFIRSFDVVSSYLKLKKISRSEFDVRQIVHLRAFLVASVIGYINYKNIQRELRRGETKFGLSKQTQRIPLSYSPISDSLLANFLEIADSTAFEYKKLAQKAKYIIIKKNIKYLNIPKSKKNEYIKGYPENAKKIRIIDGKLALRESDLVISLVRFKRYRKKYAKRKKQKKNTANIYVGFNGHLCW